MKKGVIISGNLAQDHEFIYPFYRLKEEGYEIDTFNNENKQTIGFFGTKIPPKDTPINTGLGCLIFCVIRKAY